MGVTLEEFKAFVDAQFPGADLNGLAEDEGRISGTISWNGFKGIDDRERDQQLNAKIRNQLGLQGINVDYLVPVAPGDPG